MERRYTYDKKAYRTKVEMIGYIMLALLVYSIVLQFTSGFSFIWLLAAGVSIYGVSNTFLTKSNPREIIVTDETITFVSYGQKAFFVDSLKFFRVKQISYDYQVLVRATDSRGNKGRFWVTYAFFNDKMDLIEEFNYLERKTHPESLRLRNREDVGACRPHERATEAEEGDTMPARARALPE